MAISAGNDRGVRARSFDIICAGEAVLNAVEAVGEASSLTVRSGVALRPGGGAMHAAIALSRQGLRVGLATVLPDDTGCRALLTKVSASGVDVGGVELAVPSQSIALVKGGARQIVVSREHDQPIAIPDGWSSRVLLLSGMSPLVSQGAALCKAARAARRAGSTVVVDVDARWDIWRGRDARAIRMVLREANVVWCSAQDLFALNMDIVSLRAALRPGAVLVSSDGVGHARADGPFGEVSHVLGATTAFAPLGEGEAFTSAICAELARAGQNDAEDGSLWARALRSGHSASRASHAL